MNHILNEYLVEEFATIDHRHKILINYSQFDNSPKGTINFSIFDLDGNHLITSAITEEPVLGYEMLMFNLSTNYIEITYDYRCGLEIIWDNHPGEHYICVSYSFDGSKRFEEYEIDWRKEGF